MVLYYKTGVPSWNWYYPYHHAPLASDFVDMESFRFDFTPG